MNSVRCRRTIDSLTAPDQARQTRLATDGRTRRRRARRGELSAPCHGAYAPGVGPAPLSIGRTVAIAVLAAAVGIIAAWVGYGSGHLADATPGLVGGWTAAACGLVAWRVVTWSRCGPLLVAVGITWFLPASADCFNLEPLLHRCLRFDLLAGAATALAWLWLGVLSHVTLTFPSGLTR